MKKAITLIFVCFLCLIALPVLADVPKLAIPQRIVVQFEQDFSSNKPAEDIKLVVTDNYKLPNDTIVEKNTELFLTLQKINEEKIGKRNATAEAKIVKVYIPSQNKLVDVTNQNAIVKISDYNPVNIAETVGDVGITVANHFVNHITVPANFVRGFVENQTGNRLESGAKKVYNKSILSYTQKGKALEFKKGDLAIMSFYMKNNK